MKNITYTITDLEKATGLNRRTIHFYTREKLIPPPDGTGGGARYGEEHLLRLRLIGEMQKSHLKLTGIREALDTMTIAEMRALSKKIESAPQQAWDRQALEGWLTANQPAAPQASMAEPAPEPYASGASDSFSFLNIIPPAPAAPRKTSANYLQDLKRSKPVQEEQWRRLTVADGVEINVRADVERRHRQQILHCIEALRKTLHEESGQ
jgi:DNA-binding transcriptional MerR regulator